MGQYDRLLAEDAQIIALRREIVAAKEKQVENGAATVLELMEAVRAVQEEEQRRAVHEVEKLKAAYRLSRMVARAVEK